MITTRDASRSSGPAAASDSSAVCRTVSSIVTLVALRADADTVISVLEAESVTGARNCHCICRLWPGAKFPTDRACPVTIDRKSEWWSADIADGPIWTRTTSTCCGEGLVTVTAIVTRPPTGTS